MKWHEVAKAFAMVGHVREMTAKKHFSSLVSLVSSSAEINIKVC